MDAVVLPVEEAYAALPRKEFLTRTAAYNVRIKEMLEARLQDGAPGQEEAEN